MLEPLLTSRNHQNMAAENGEEALMEMNENNITRKPAETVKDHQDARKALTKSERRLKEIQGLAHAGYWELDLKTNALEWSDEIYRIIGVKPQEIDPSCEAAMATVHPDDRGYVARTHKESLSKITPCNMEYRLLLRDGTVK